MIHRRKNAERLGALFVLGLALFLPPLLLVFNSPVRIIGIPLLYFYLFLVWALTILLAALAARKLERDVSSTPDDDRDLPAHARAAGGSSPDA